MKTLEVEVEMMNYLTSGPNIVVPNIYWGMKLLYEADLVSLTPSNFATEIEIKVSPSDLKADKNKFHYHDSDLFKYLYFAVPEDLKKLALQEIPDRAGLYVVRKITEGHQYQNVEFPYCVVDKVKPAVKNKNCREWTSEQRNKFLYLGAIRILDLKRKILGFTESQA